MAGSMQQYMAGSLRQICVFGCCKHSMHATQLIELLQGNATYF